MPDELPEAPAGATSDGQAPDRYSPHGHDEITHLCPPTGSGQMPCCGRLPLEVPMWHRLTLKPELVTCPGKEEATDAQH